MDGESYWDGIAYDFGLEPKNVQECTNWFIDKVLDQTNQVKKAKARLGWHQMWTKKTRILAAEWVKTLRPGKVVCSI